MAPIILTDRDRARFWRLVGSPDCNGCRPWQGGKHPRDGHGRFKLNGRKEQAHRVALTLAGRAIPDGHEVMHQCPGGDNPACCEESHLTTGTPKMHGADRSAKGQGPRSKAGLPFGVKRSKSGRRYEAALRIGSRIVFLGCFDTAEEASAAAVEARDRRNAAQYETATCAS